MQENKRFVRTLFVSLDFIADLNMVITMSANDGAFKICIALIRALYPLCMKETYTSINTY